VARVGVALFGLGDLRDALARLPAALQAEARQAIVSTTTAAAAELRAVYPIGPAGRFYKRKPIVPGGLRRGVKTKLTEAKGITTGTVLSTAPHAILWEFGTVNRTTTKGWFRGSTKSNKARGLIAIRTRRQRQLRQTLGDILARDGDFRLQGAA
jgi:hypothetical protein